MNRILKKIRILFNRARLNKTEEWTEIASMSNAIYRGELWLVKPFRRRLARYEETYGVYHPHRSPKNIRMLS